MKTIYEGSGYWIEQDDDGRVYFSDEQTYQAELAHPLNDYSYIKYDENMGWCYKNGRELPWKE